MTTRQSHRAMAASSRRSAVRRIVRHENAASQYATPTPRVMTTTTTTNGHHLPRHPPHHLSSPPLTASPAVLHVRALAQHRAHGGLAWARAHAERRRVGNARHERATRAMMRRVRHLSQRTRWVVVGCRIEQIACRRHGATSLTWKRRLNPTAFWLGCRCRCWRRRRARGSCGPTRCPRYRRSGCTMTRPPTAS